MAKNVLKKAGLGAVEDLLTSLMPELKGAIDAVRADIRQLDFKVESVRQENADKFERTQDLINELGQRIARLEGKLEGIIELSRNSDQLLERVVRLEINQSSRRKRAS